jgi:hypothetical protein
MKHHFTLTAEFELEMPGGYIFSHKQKTEIASAVDEAIHVSTRGIERIDRFDKQYFTFRHPEQIKIQLIDITHN